MNMKKPKNTTNDLTLLIDRLQEYQLWRRGDIDEYPVDPTQLGKDLDEVIKILKKISKGNLDIHKWGSNNKV